MPVSTPSKKAHAKKLRRLKITKAKAIELLAKKEELHPIAASIVQAVATEQLEEVVIYAAPEKLIPLENIHQTPPREKTWWEKLWS